MTERQFDYQKEKQRFDTWLFKLGYLSPKQLIEIFSAVFQACLGSYQVSNSGEAVHASAGVELILPSSVACPWLTVQSMSFLPLMVKFAPFSPSFRMGLQFSSPCQASANRT